MQILYIGYLNCLREVLTMSKMKIIRPTILVLFFTSAFLYLPACGADDVGTDATIGPGLNPNNPVLTSSQLPDAGRLSPLGPLPETRQDASVEQDGGVSDASTDADYCPEDYECEVNHGQCVSHCGKVFNPVFFLDPQTARSLFRFCKKRCDEIHRLCLSERMLER